MELCVDPLCGGEPMDMKILVVTRSVNGGKQGCLSTPRDSLKDDKLLHDILSSVTIPTACALPRHAYGRTPTRQSAVASKEGTLLTSRKSEPDFSCSPTQVDTPPQKVA